MKEGKKRFVQWYNSGKKGCSGNRKGEERNKGFKKKGGERYILALTSIPGNVTICKLGRCRCDAILENSGSLI